MVQHATKLTIKGSDSQPKTAISLLPGRPVAQAAAWDVGSSAGALARAHSPRSASAAMLTILPEAVRDWRVGDCLCNVIILFNDC